MSHDLALRPGITDENEAARAAAYAFAYRGEPGWHGLGVKAEDGDSNAAVAARAGVAGTFEVVRLADLLGSLGSDVTVMTDDAAVVQNVDGMRVMRSAGVSANFSPWQPDDILRTIDAITSGGAILDTVGLIGKAGALAFMTFRLNEGIEVAGDQIMPYLNVRVGYDGTCARQIDVSPVRVVCANTLAAAWSRRTKTRLSVRNTVHADFRTLEARQTLGLAFKSTEAWAADYARLMEQEVTDAKFSEIVKAILPDTDTDRGNTRRENARNLLTEIYNTGQAAHPFFELPGGTKLRPQHDTVGASRGTVGGVLNAVNEWQTWYATPRAADKETGRIDYAGWFAKIGGTNEQTNDKLTMTYEKVLAVAGVSL